MDWVYCFYAATPCSLLLMFWKQQVPSKQVNSLKNSSSDPSDYTAHETISFLAFAVKTLIICMFLYRLGELFPVSTGTFIRSKIFVREFLCSPHNIV
jgi:hypothetical protein